MIHVVPRSLLSSYNEGLPMSSSIFDVVAPYTLIGDEQLATLYELSLTVSDASIPGDIVEAGVCNGGSAALIAQPHAHNDTRRLYLYDTFEGIPPATPEDGHLAQSHTGAWKGAQDKVREVLALVGYPDKSVVWRKGVFAATMALGQPLPARIALLHCDADWFSSVLLALRTFYPLVSDGGYVVLDDWGHWQGCRKAFYTWSAETGETPLLERTGRYGVWWQKNRISNVPNRDMQ